MDLVNNFMPFVTSLSHADFLRVRRQLSSDAPSCCWHGEPKDVVDRRFADAREIAGFFEDGVRYRLVDKCMCELLVLDFSKRTVLINCLLVIITSIAWIDILNALSPNPKDAFQFFSRNRSQDYVELFE
jgi:hypothetical protein